MDTLTEMRGALGRVHEFLIALEKAGFTEEIIVETINSKGNKLAGEMFNALPEALRTKWKLSDLILIFRVDLESAHKKFLKTISSNYDEELFTEGKRVSIENEVSGDVHGKVFHFNYFISDDDAIKKMKKQDYRPATDYEASTFCELNKAWAKNYKVCALGTAYNLRGTYYTSFYYIDRGGKDCLAVERSYDEGDNIPSTRFLGIKIK